MVSKEFGVKNYVASQDRIENGIKNNRIYIEEIICLDMCLINAIHY